MLYKGRGKIEITEQSYEINRNNLVDILNDIMPLVVKAHTEADYLNAYRLGSQPILSKKRESEEDVNKNNIVVENHALKLVNFKTAYLISDGFKYSQTDDKVTDDVSTLNKYYIDQNKVPKDYALATWMYTAGTAYRLIRPVPKPKIDTLDLRGDSPFDIVNLDNDKTFVAYTTAIGGGAALSGYVVQTKDDEYSFTIYTDEKIFTFKTNSKETIPGNVKIKEVANPLGYNPIIEYPLNEARIGVVDVAYSMLNAINVISSNQVDDVVDFVNSILVLYNVNVDPEKMKALRELGAMEVNDKNPQSPAKVEYVANQLSHSEVNETVDRVVRTLYDIVGVPIASGQVTSGGDTGEARKLGNGYESADLIIKLEEGYFTQSERAALKIELNICKTLSNCPINELLSSEIQINPTRHNLDNILSKTQALTMLDQIGFPEEAALILTSLGANPHELAALWKQNKQKIADEKAARAPQINGDANDNANDNIDDNPVEQTE